MNNIYFDKLPETIAKSSNEDDVNTTEVRMWFKSDVKISPLSDRLAEERKKVVQMIKAEFEPKNATELDEDKISTEAHLVNFGWDRCKEKLLKKLDQIERGE